MRLVAVVLLAIVLPGCAQIEERQNRERRQQAETSFVEAVSSSPLATVRASLEQDRTLANAFRMEQGKRSSYPRESALTMAVKRRPRDMVALLLEFGADPNLPQADGESPLSIAIRSQTDSASKVGLLLEKGADPDKIFTYGSALHQAATLSPEAARDIYPLLLAKAAGTGGFDRDGWTPLHSAASSANPL